MSLPIVRRSNAAPVAAWPEHVHPILANVYAARAVASPADLDLSLRHMLPFHQLRDIDPASERLADAVCTGQRILVVGDFDADGATGCAVAVRGLRLLGAENVDFLVPNRFEFGYGLTPEIVDVAAQRNPDLIVTVDNGVSSLEGVAVASARGIPVLVTDHHLPGDELPGAVAIVNPNAGGCTFPSKAISGVGVVFYLLAAVRAKLRERGRFDTNSPGPNLAALLDLVALGTVADVVPLDRNNRILVAQGLARIRAGRCQPGITALLDVAKRDASRAVASDLGFAVGPRLNAAGRLTDMALGVNCLLCDDPREARAMAEQLDTLNRERRKIEADMRTEAMASVTAFNAGGANSLPPALCLFEPHWHPGVIGIVAGRIKDKAHRPVIAFAPDADGALRGSARSVPGMHMRDALALVDARLPGLIVRFGGHAMAAGLTIESEQLEAFRAAFTEVVRDTVPAEALTGTLLSDGELSAGDLGLPLARGIREGGPWGSGFPEPLFDGEFDVHEQRIVGENHLKMRLSPAGESTSLAAIAFNAVDDVGDVRLGRVRLVYRLVVNDFRGRESAQLMVEQIEPL